MLYNEYMLIIGHRGAAGLAKENTLDAMRAGFNAGADILEIDVRLTSDSVPVLAHDAIINGKRIAQHSLADLRNDIDIPTLREVLDAFYGKILLNIEIKRAQDASIIYEAVNPYATNAKDWDNILFSSFKPGALISIRHRNNRANLALLHHINPFTYMRYHKKLNLSAVGFHRLHVNVIALAVAKELGIFTYVYTVDRPGAATKLQRRGVDGIVTNYPDKIIESLTL